MAPQDNRTLGELMGELSSNTTRLVRREFELATTEMTAKVRTAGGHVARAALVAVVTMGIGYVLINKGASALRNTSVIPTQATIRSLTVKHGLGICLHDMPGSATERDAAGPFVYVRFHGSSTRYGGSYSDDRLQRWAMWLNDRLEQGCDVYAYFHNDVGGHAPRNALTLRRMLERAAADRTLQPLQHSR